MTPNPPSLYIRRMGSMKRRGKWEAQQWAKAADCYRVSIDFERLGPGWRVTFRQTGSNTPLPRTLTFADPDKLRELYTRFGTRRMSEDIASFEFGVATGRGIVELTLGAEQYRILRQEKPSPRE